MSFSRYTAAALLNAMFSKTSNYGALGSPPTIYVGLSSTAPTAAGGDITEPSVDDYARVATAASDWNAATDADPPVIANANAVTFAKAQESWGDPISHFVLMDAETGGNLIGFDTIKGSQSGDAITKQIGEDDQASFGVGALTCALE